MTTTQCTCTGCAVQQGTHKPAEAVHQIDEPQAEALLELAAYRFTVENREARIAELEGQLEAIGAGGVEPLRKQAAAPQEEAIAEIVSASHDQAEFGERAINFLRDFQHLEYGTKLYPAPQAVQAAVPEAIEQMAVDRYKVVPSHESMFHRWAVVAGNGTQQLYIGREVECQNMALKFAGAFLDGAFVAMQNTAPAHPAEGVPAQAVAVADARSARQITDAIVENFKDAGWYVPSVDEALVLEAVSAAIVEHGTTEPLTGVATDVDSMARVLMAAFAKAEPEHPITRYPTSFVSTFADMARAALAATQLADGVPAQSYVADFFRENGFYPSLAQAFAAGVAHAAATQPAAQAVQPFGWLITKSKLPGDVEFTQDPARENLARSFGYQTQALYDQPAAQGMDAGKLLAEKHTGMKVDYRGLLGQVRRAIKRTAGGHEEMLRQLEGHITELGQRWYAGDTDVVDELLQLYCVESEARAAIAAQAKQGGAANG